MPCAVVNPRQVRHFAEAMGCLEKTDRIDCGMIAWFAKTKKIKPTPPASDTQAQLAALVLRLRQLTESRVEQHNQRRLVTDPDVLASFTAVLCALAAQVKQIEGKITGLIGADPLWTALDAVWREVKGVAGRTVARLMAGMPEIGTLSGKAAAKLAGLAPIARDSGTSAGKRPVRGGQEGVRSILFIVASVVRRFDPDFKDMSERMTRAGKPKKVILAALAHKLLTRLNAQGPRRAGRTGRSRPQGRTGRKERTGAQRSRRGRLTRQTVAHPSPLRREREQTRLLCDSRLARRRDWALKPFGLAGISLAPQQPEGRPR